MAQTLIALTTLGFFCLLGIVLLALPLVFLAVGLHAYTKRQRSEHRSERRSDMLLDQQFLQLYLRNQRAIDEMTSPPPRRATKKPI